MSNEQKWELTNSIRNWTEMIEMIEIAWNDFQLGVTIMDESFMIESWNRYRRLTRALGERRRELDNLITG